MKRRTFTNKQLAYIEAAVEFKGDRVKIKENLGWMKLYLAKCAERHEKDPSYPKYGRSNQLLYAMKTNPRITLEIERRNRGGLVARDVTTDRVLGHLAKHAFSGVRDAQTIRAIELLMKHLGLDNMAQSDEAGEKLAGKVLLKYSLSDKPRKIIDVEPSDEKNKKTLDGVFNEEIERLYDLALKEGLEPL